MTSKVDSLSLEFTDESRIVFEHRLRTFGTGRAFNLEACGSEETPRSNLEAGEVTPSQYADSWIVITQSFSFDKRVFGGRIFFERNGYGGPS